MIYPVSFYKATCEKCGKTVELNGADEDICSQQLLQIGWLIWANPRTFQPLHTLCPDCKNKRK